MAENNKKSTVEPQPASLVTVRVMDIPSGAERRSSDANADVVPVGHKDAAFTARAFKGVVRDRLQERYDLFLITLCTHAMNGISIGVRCLELANKRPLFRPLEHVSVGIALKALDASLFLAKLSNRALHRQLLGLQSDEFVEKLRDCLAEGGGVDVGLVDDLLDAVSEVDSPLCCPDRGLGQ
ncbi:hypothetical protein [Salipiger abyssi]|uniref:hypothetical protein n=1 Tax=Salipiger abyssi TaxID=1250539 RepID=UPI0018DCA6EC|nr:hypothetical protein [Salipiger abyssi]